ncbi:unnamed protein product [Callosobruchus maculatus]|uniref:CUB domain-containing protein n=1 Tax=Callosobruchus maculatus TaxID=64391 RepID=A0A653D6Y8_CALMS|nr:unnamed protein product [Callosobruchus maculatus]
MRGCTRNVTKLFLFGSVLVLCKLTLQEQIRKNSRAIGSGSSWFGDLDASRARAAAVSSRRGRFLSLFTYVQLNNPECVASNGDYGICTTPTECKQRGGVVDGPCAGGYGTCCIFMVSCGSTIRENGTYFVNNGYPEPFEGTGSCQATLLKANQDVCQFRLEFAQLNLVGPEEVNHICNTDQFIVSGGNPVRRYAGTAWGTICTSMPGLG